MNIFQRYWKKLKGRQEIRGVDRLIGTSNLAVENILDSGNLLTASVRICGGSAHGHRIPLNGTTGKDRYRQMNMEIELLDVMYKVMTGPPAPLLLCECDIDRSNKWYPPGPAPRCYKCGRYLDLSKTKKGPC